MKKTAIQTGSVEYVIEQLSDIFPESIKEDRSFSIQNNIMDLHYEWHFPFDGIEIGIHRVKFKNEFDVDVLSDQNDKKYIYFQFEFVGSSSPKSPDDVQALSSSKVSFMSMQSTGIFLKTHAKKGDESKWISLRVSEDYFHTYMAHMEKHIGKVFDTNNPWIIYEIIPPKITLLLSDIFALNSSMTPPMRNSIIIARSIEATGTFLDMIIKRKEQSINKSLHIDDINNMQHIRNELVELYDKTPSLSYFTDKYGISLSKLKRDFESVFGTTIPRFHLNYRLEMAYRMLEGEQVSITETARYFGFKSSSNFSENFKDKFGVTPKDISIRYK